MKKELLERYISGKATLNERKNVVAWLDSDQKNVRELMALHKLYNITIMNQIEPAEQKAFLVMKHKSIKYVWKKAGIEIIKIAAIVAILLGINSLKNTDQGYQTIYVPSGQRAELTLPDSTKVWLNSHSRLTYPLTFNKKQREVQLDGEGYFEVAHNKKAFVVKTQNVNVQVLGTEFNMKTYSNSDSDQIDLLKGSIELSGGTLKNKTYRMQPAESVYITNGTIKVSKIKNYDYFKWKEGLICFDKESVANIFKKLEIYYGININVSQHKFLEEYYSGKFRIRDGVEQVLKILQLEYEFTYTKDNSLNLITIK